MKAKTEKESYTAIFDLQSVLETPSTFAGELFYSRKLHAYNLSVYSLGISDPSQYKSPGLTKSSGLPPKLRPFKLKMPKAYSNSETHTTADASTQTVSLTPTEDLKDPFQTMMPTYSAFNGNSYGGGMSSLAGLNVDFSGVNINDYTPLATPEDFACGSSVDDYRPFGSPRAMSSVRILAKQLGLQLIQAYKDAMLIEYDMVKKSMKEVKQLYQR
ncbi:unnamed protein product [Owenia fusiformis]|uniref:Uncharacterized protein n=1 Tax=Owenia fusiformis TaxID=6347 RepID=A0A8S4NWL8_OWEFU|nr:unnamed protein product [Owenia fusiformis]